MTLPFLDIRRQHAALRQELDEAIASVVGGDRFIGGPRVEAFEQAFASYCGAEEAVGVASGTDAIELSLRALEIGPAAFLRSHHQGDAGLDDSRRVNDAVGLGSRSLIALELPNDFLQPIMVASGRKELRHAVDPLQPLGTRYRTHPTSEITDELVDQFVRNMRNCRR